MFSSLSMAHQIGLRKVRPTKEQANNMQYVKELLRIDHETAIFQLEHMVAQVCDISIAEIYLKTLPVYFVYSIVNKICINRCEAIITKITQHPLFRPHHSLFAEWALRFTKVHTSTPAKKYNRTRPRMETAASRVLGYSDLDFFIVLYKWVKYHKLHKYSYFFANITYTEFLNLNEETIDSLNTKVGLFPITTGARGTIIRRLSDEVTHRTEKLERFVNLSFEEEEMKDCLAYLKKVFHTPIWRKSTLPLLLERVITIVIEAILAGSAPSAIRESAIRVLESAYACYFFVATQKSKFNTLRCRLIRIAKEENMENTERLAEESPLEENLKKIELALMQAINEDLYNERIPV